MSRAKGNKAEAQAREFLQKSGFMVVDSNFYSRYGEIDIIALKEGVYHFVEVKSALDYETALNNITPSKLLRIIKTAEVYLKRNLHVQSYCFDAIIITPHNMEFLENITL